MSLSLCCYIHLLQRFGFEIRNNNVIICCSTHIGYVLQPGGNSGDGPLLLSSKSYFAIILAVTSPLKMKTILERMHLNLAVVRLWLHS